jgi:microcompartment protein CcmK/EutM
VKIARVIGKVVATLKHADFVGYPLLVVQPEDVDGLRGGSPVLAIDRIGVDVGERILLVDDGAAARGLLGRAGPIRAMILGRVDEVATSAGPLGQRTFLH